MSPASRLVLVLFATLSLAALPTSQGAGQQPTAFPLVTDLANLPLSDRFFWPNSTVRLADSGDVYFYPALTLFRWTTTGGRQRVLQPNDPHPGIPDSLMEGVGGSLRVNAAGHAAMVNTWTQKGVRDPSGLFVYDGAGFHEVALSGGAVPDLSGYSFSGFRDLRLNDHDQVAFVANMESAGGSNSQSLLRGAPGDTPVPIATVGESAPGTGGGVYNGFTLIGLNNTGHVAFNAAIEGGTTNAAVFVADSSGVVTLIAANGMAAPGTTSGTFRNLSGYVLNGNGDVAFVGDVFGDNAIWRGIWIGGASSSLQKLAVNNDSIGPSLGGNFGGSITLRGFGDDGRVLFQSNPAGSATSAHALFLKKLGSTAEVVFSRGQPVPGEAPDKFDQTQQASLSSSGKVAFLASLKDGSIPCGWFLGSGEAEPEIIALQGDSTPVGGTFGLAGRNMSAEINGKNQVLFRADILGPNAVGAFLWTPDSGLESVVNTGDTLPPGANVVILSGWSQSASDDELIVYAMKAGGLASAFAKPLHGVGGKMRRIVGDLDPAPGGGTMGNLSIPVIHDQEQVTFTSSLVGAFVYPATVLWMSKPGVGLAKQVMTGDPAPGLAGGTFSGISGPTTTNGINNAGQVVFFANVAGSTDNSSPSGIFIVSPGGSVQAVARAGDSSPAGGTFVSFNSIPWFNDAGQVAFQAVSQSENVQKQGLFVRTAAAQVLAVVAQGDPAPGGSTIESLAAFKMNAAGQVAYIAGLASGGQGVFLGAGGQPSVSIAMKGGVAPGTGECVFDGFFGSSGAALDVNSQGQVAFWAYLKSCSILSGFFIGSPTASPAPRLLAGQALPGGGTAWPPRPQGLALADSGELAMYVVGLDGAPNLPRFVIADRNGVLRKFASTGDEAIGTGSEFGRLITMVWTNSASRFFFHSKLLDGPAKAGIFWNGGGKP